MADDEFVQVMDVEVLAVGGASLSHTVRFHEGDALSETELGNVRIDRGSREVLVGAEKRPVAGEVITIAGDKIVQMTRRMRWEPRVRPSAKLLTNREKAEVDALAKRLGVPGRGSINAQQP